MSALRLARLLALSAALASVAPAAAAGGLSDAEAREVLAALEGERGEAARAAIERVIAADDRRFAPVLIELLRAAALGIAAPGVRDASARALERLTGESFGADWPAWMRWYADTELEPPPGFVGWKGRLLGRIDPAFARLLQGEHPVRTRPAEIVWGGVAYEGIPALDEPATIPAGEADWLGEGEPVFGVALAGEARAYPLRILDWHELANDTLGGVPFSLAYCTLCGSGIAYDARVPGVDASPLTFGSSGLLVRSNKLMVDRQTETLWNQLTGRPVLGPLADREIRLEVLPSVVTTWSDWRARHPDTTVLALDTGHVRPYHPGAAYAGYFASDDTMFPVRRDRRELPAKERVFGLEREGRARAWPLPVLLEERVVNDRLAGEPVVIVAEGDRIEVDGESVRTGPARYTAGATVRAYRRGEHAFRPVEDEGGGAHLAAGSTGAEIADTHGARWRVEEDALVGPDGARLPRLPGVLAYWFGWHSFHPRTELYGTGSAGPAPR